VINTSGIMSVIDTTSNTVSGIVSLGGQPDSLAISTDGSRIYVSDDGSNMAWIVDTATNRIENKILVGGRPGDVAVTSAAARNLPVVVTGSQTYGSQSASFTVAASPPAGDTFSGTVTCDAVNSPPTAISPTLAPGTYILNGASCSGLTLNGPTASGYEINYSGSLTVNQTVPPTCFAGSGSGSGPVSCATTTTAQVVAGATTTITPPTLPVTGSPDELPFISGAALIAVMLGARHLRRRSRS
jgi:YVTN family beta-propeller protein